jgi:DNA-binding transcriptional LysR family regulator
VTRRERPEIRSFYLACRQAGKTPPPWEMEITSWEVMKAWVLAGLGVGIFPQYVIAAELKNRSLRRLPVPGWSHPYEIKLLAAKEAVASKNLKLFASYLSNVSQPVEK